MKIVWECAQWQQTIKGSERILDPRSQNVTFSGKRKRTWDRKITWGGPGKVLIIDLSYSYDGVYHYLMNYAQLNS